MEDLKNFIDTKIAFYKKEKDRLYFDLNLCNKLGYHSEVLKIQRDTSYISEIIENYEEIYEVILRD